MSDSAIRELGRRFAKTGSHEDRIASMYALCRAGLAVWVLRYEPHSTGLDNILIGLFWSYGAAHDHLRRHEPDSFPGWARTGSAHEDARPPGRWVAGSWRNGVVRCVAVHAAPQEEHFCTRPEGAG